MQYAANNLCLMAVVMFFNSCSKPTPPIRFEGVGEKIKSPHANEYDVAAAYLKRGKVNEAEEKYRALKRKEPYSSYPLEGLAGCHLLRLEYIEAIELYDQALELNPDSIDAKIGLAGAYILARNYKAALAAYLDAKQMNENHPMVHWGLYITYDNLGRYGDAKRHLSQFKNLTPNRGSILEVKLIK